MAGDSSFFEPAAGQCDEVLELLVHHIAQLPPMQKTVLALSYHENLERPEIAACLGLTEDEIDQVRVEAVELLRAMVSAHTGVP